MAKRIQLIQAGGPKPAGMPPRVNHAFKLLAMIRVLTRRNGPGNPDLVPTVLRGVKDLLALGPWQVVSVEDEDGEPISHEIDYALGVGRPPPKPDPCGHWPHHGSGESHEAV